MNSVRVDSRQVRNHGRDFVGLESPGSSPKFHETRDTPRVGKLAPTDIALAYIDCDLYSSTMPVLEFLLPRLKNGMIIAFDDYFCWSATQLSERAQGTTGILFPLFPVGAGALRPVWMARAVVRRRRPENPGRLIDRRRGCRDDQRPVTSARCRYPRHHSASASLRDSTTSSRATRRSSTAKSRSRCGAPTSLGHR